jgi:transposase
MIIGAKPLSNLVLCYGWIFRILRISGLWEKVNTALREEVRIQMGREAQPSAAITDSQSVKTTEKEASWL